MNLSGFEKRKKNRLKEYDYSSNGLYYLTLCTDERKQVLCDFVGDGILDVPQISFCNIIPSMLLTPVGCIAEETIDYIDRNNADITIDKYVIMPNHVHFIVFVNQTNGVDGVFSGGTSRMPSPTNMTIPKFVSSFKRFTNKKTGKEIWQRSYYDHVIRSEKEYHEIWRYIDENPLKWQEDELYQKA